ncbi:MAG TPA: bifunctional transaldolase/phosoglucose isomerase [Terriglobales bacterium]|nr:bifunctional transaldolase/phosoglucose isomerase [Terriglobales bacterium]
MASIKELHKYGQSIWLDYIRRNLITSGDLKRLVDDGLTGMTSNPTIFDKAIGGGSDYDESLRAALSENPNATPEMLFDRIEIEDIQMAADVLRPIYDQTGGEDGYVSMEVPASLAHQTDATIKEARRLWKAVNRPNVMIKVPATPEGMPAVEELIAGGINVNITLMFSLRHYEAVAAAYLRGLKRTAKPQQVASVASFFVSRVDTKVDAALEKIGTPEAKALLGKIGIANCKRVYRRFKEIFLSAGFDEFKRRGARVQRPLWASTSTKNPAYPDLMYVDELIGPHTVNTLPPATLEAFRDHGRAAPTLDAGIEEAEAQLAQLERVGVNLDAIAEELSVEGIAAFDKSMTELLHTLDEKRKKLRASNLDRQPMNLGAAQSAVEQRLTAWEKDNFNRRLWDKDYKLWSATPVPELTDRMGWLTLPDSMQQHVKDLESFSQEIKSAGYRYIVLLGMGGSSLAPEVYQRTFGNATGYPELVVLDSTHPEAVRAVEKRIDLQHTLFLVSSKSGTTTEMLSFFYYFWKQVSAKDRAAGKNFVAITDPGTPLEKLARERGFRRVFPGSPEVGGRYAALSLFGLVPAALIGVNVKRLLDEARKMSEASVSCLSPRQCPGLTLGAALGELALAKRDKVTFLASRSLAAFPVWVEQLIAESTGKHGKGIVPVADEPLADPSVYGEDRFFVLLHVPGEDQDLERRAAALETAGHPIVRILLQDKYELGQEFFRWEIAVAAAGSVLGINPFDQPDVQLAKELAKKAMEALSAKKTSSADSAEAAPTAASDAQELSRALLGWLASARPNDYVSLQAYLRPSAETDAALTQLRTIIRSKSRLATTAGYGPRFLHSTGQLHKGGPNTGLFLQLVDEPSDDLAVPETNYTFGQLIRAQALGDFQALKQRGRRVLRIQLEDKVKSGLENLVVTASSMKEVAAGSLAVA